MLSPNKVSVLPGILTDTFLLREQDRFVFWWSHYRVDDLANFVRGIDRLDLVADSCLVGLSLGGRDQGSQLFIGGRLAKPPLVFSTSIRNVDHNRVNRFFADLAFDLSIPR